MNLFKYSILSFILFISISAFGQKPGLQWPEGIRGTDYNVKDLQGKRQGVWVKEWSKNPKILLYKGQFKNDLPTGVFEWYYDSGELSALMDHVQDTMVNYLTYFDQGTHTKMSEGRQEKTKVEGAWRMLKEGTWQLYNTGGIRIGEENYLHGSLHGTCRYNYPSGKLYQVVEYKNGLKDGPSIEYFEDGVKKLECTYKNDMYDGSIKHYFPSGALQFTGQYLSGLKDGTWTMFNTSPKVEMIVSYKLGDEVKRIYMNGTFVEHYEGGIPKSEYNYENGKKDGPFEEWYDKGEFQLVPGSLDTRDGAPTMTEKLVGAQLAVKGDYLNDQLEGEVIYYNEDGTINRIEEWTGGKLFNTRKRE
ncbi:MAG: toxin-antitoxin system YwqK family antitoxin [Flavobacteriales bacterium]|nr:toxin-antitoxin system YwqK family antitoxin [Flavobacteriales bacterium]